jgi:ABC-type lipoprotein export system ATPase subunit
VSALAIEARDVFRLHETGAAVALRGLSLEVGTGELAVVGGPSGSGKTTLLRLIAGLDAPSAGRINVLGEEPSRLRGRARAAFRTNCLGFLDQRYAQALSPDLSCREAVELPLALRGARPSQRRQRARFLLERVGLADRADELPWRLSGGEQQRVALCASLAHRPGLLLADEPAGELDEASAALVYALIRELVREDGATALVVSHDDAAFTDADRRIWLHDGRVSREAFGDDIRRAVVDSAGWLRLANEQRTRIGPRASLVDLPDGVAVVGTRTPQDVPAPVARARPATPGEIVAVAAGLTRELAGRRVLDGLDLYVRRGELCVLTGRSGSGKTTLLRLLAGLDRPDSGDVVLLGRPLALLDRTELARLRRAHVGIVPQESGLVPFLGARENVELGLLVHGMRDGAAARAACDAVGLSHRLELPVSRLSAGERARVAIARALASNPALLLADEPTSRLDRDGAAAIAELLMRLARDQGAAVVCATHDRSVVERADISIVLGTGSSSS